MTNSTRFVLTNPQPEMRNSQEPSQPVEEPTAATAFNTSLRQLLTNECEEDKQRIDNLFAPIVTLCPLSFCAYSDANSKHGWPEFTEDGCIIQHLSWHCLKQHVKEVLKITLEGAGNVLATNGNEGSGRYFVFSTGSSRERTEDGWSGTIPGLYKSQYLFIKRNFKIDCSKLHIELHKSGSSNSKNKKEPLVHMSRRVESLGSASIAMSEVLKVGNSPYKQQIKLRKSRSSDEAAFVSFHKERIDLKVAWEEYRKNIEASDAWEQHMPKSRKDLDWPLLDEENNSALKPIGFINAVKMGTQVWIYADQDTKTMAIAFRGTERRRWEDVRAVFHFLPSKLYWESAGSCKLSTTLGKEDDGTKVHAGFEKAYRAVRIALLELVYSITEWSKEWTICLTGHSLGGALAALCSFDYAHLGNNTGNKPNIFMMSFGAPRVGNKAFKEAYKKAVKQSYRVACGKDIICAVPFHFYHVGKALQFEKDGRVRFSKRLLVNVKLEAICIENKLTEDAIQRWNCRVKHNQRIRRQSTPCDRWKQATAAHLQQESSTRTLSHCASSKRYLVGPLQATVRNRSISRSISRRTLLSAQSVQLEQLQLNQGADDRQVLPSISNHSEACYHRFVHCVARRVEHSARCKRHSRRRSCEKFKSVIRSIQYRLTQQQDSSATNQNFEGQNK